MGFITGCIGGIIDGYSVECDVRDNRIFGRLGGALVGANIDLNISPDGNYIEGRIGGSIIGKDFKMQKGEGSARGRLGGDVIGNDIVLSGNDHITGRCGGSVVGFDIDLHFDASTGKLTGRLGGGLIGMDVNYEIVDTPPIYGAIVAAITYYFYRENQRRGSKGG